MTGTGTLTVPLATSPGRAGFGPSLALQYDSGAGNGPFGVGWSLSLPAITCKTDNGLPRYQEEPEDTFILSGAEDLVPVLEEHEGLWRRAPQRRSVEGDEFTVERYRPRIEGLFARIERWTDLSSGETHWRSITPDNVTTLYGTTNASRIADPNDPRRVFSWLICETYDDTGNAIVYEYKAENGDGVDPALPHERNRTTAGRSANRYPKRITYGNRVSPLVEPDLSHAEWLFEVVFDYGEHDPDEPLPEEVRPWRCRRDPFSSYRPGFEVRTYRVCQRVLMFHHFPDEEEVGRDCLVRSTDLSYHDDPVASFIESVVQSGYRRRTQGGYAKKSLPPLEFAYSQAVIDEHVRSVDPESLENLPTGLDGSAYRWVDLDGEGLAGLLTEQAHAWFYKPNLGGGHFGPIQPVAAHPSLAALSGRRQEFLDLAGDGQLDLVDLSDPTPGFFERTPDREWAPFRPFPARPDLAWDDPNLHIVDVTGDGHADVLIADGDTLSWYASLAENGFGSVQRVHHSLDEEHGPRLVSANPTEAIYLADMSGDGLSDIVRVRNGEVCYWPSLGYGHFGARITMDDAPQFDEPDQFDQRRIRVADIDGSGATDLIYLHRDTTRIYSNRSGNSWSPPRSLTHSFPRIDSVAQVGTIDLLGEGTACLVWSSPLPSEMGRPLRFVNLMGGQKPHLLTVVRNNLGAETHLHYAPSTRFYLADKVAGRPWVTRLPFPVHVVERVETLDRISRNRFVTRYAYHHGFYDGVEREFRGFGMVEQFDTESFAALSAGAEAANIDETTHVPPVLTRTWFHTGALLEGERISRQFAAEYFREADHCEAYPDELLLPDTVLPDAVQRPGWDPLPWRLTLDEQQQACRALTGSLLRQEIYAHDGSAAQDRPYTIYERNYTIQMLQPGAEPSKHAVVVVHPRENIVASYERALYQVGGELCADPRVSHEVILDIDDFGNVLRSVSIGYGRRHADPDPGLAAADHDRQRHPQVVAIEHRYTAPVENPDAYRTPQPAETLAFELHGLVTDAQRPGSTNLFGFDELAVKYAAITDELPYECVGVDSDRRVGPARRLIEHTRTLYRRDDLAGPLPLGELQPKALPLESYRLAFTADLLAKLYSDRVDNAMMIEGGGYVHLDGGWWIPSGRVFYAPSVDVAPEAELEHARHHFFLPQRFRDAFGTSTSLIYDPFDLLLSETRDGLNNRISACNDYRVLRPHLVTDANGNQSEVAFDTLGLVVGTAVTGKPSEGLGDSLFAFLPDLDDDLIADYLNDPSGRADSLLKDATTRVVYDLFSYARSRDDQHPQPVVFATLVRETHAADLEENQPTRVQQSFSYSDGFGREIQKKVQAEPGPMVHAGPDVNPRWVGSGWTIFNNKGKPVRQYEPFFSDDHSYEFAVLAGVSSVLFYDPLGRVLISLNPNETWDKVAFEPWREVTWDVNDTVLLDPGEDTDVGGFVRPHLTSVGGWSGWYALRVDGKLGSAERIAARKAAAHAGTPTRVWLDTMGRAFLTQAHNRAAGVEELLSTRVQLDVEGNEREVLDPKGRRVMRSDYDMLNSRVGQASMDAGERLLLNDVVGRPIFIWNSRGFRFRTEYDLLRRPVRSWVGGSHLDGELLHERTEYGEGQTDNQRRNLRTRIFRQYDGAGVVTHEAYDFKGNLLNASRQLAEEYRRTLDWRRHVPLQQRVFRTQTRYDALNRPVDHITPDGSVVRAAYNEANLLERLEANLHGSDEDTVVIADMDYNARGQRTLCVHGNGVRTSYDHDPLTFRLSRLRTLRDRQPLQDLTYTYDPAGNVTHIRDDAQQTVFFRNRRVEPNTDYTYDAIYRLTEATGREHLGQATVPVPTSPSDVPRVRLPHPGDGKAMGRYLERYVYDELGNFLQLHHRGSDPASPGWRRTFRYVEPSLLEADRASNRLTSTSDGGDGAPQPLTYDAHGNTTSMPELPLLRWNQKDQLQATASQVIGNGGTPETIWYVYDASGQRIRKVTERKAAAGQRPARKAERVYVGTFEVYREYAADGDANLERETLHILDGEQRIALVETRTMGDDRGPVQLQRHQIANNLGSPTVELDADARVISYEEYMPYGNTSYQAARGGLDANPKRYRHNAKERDEQTGFYHNGARYYAPWLCRWTACDPIGLGDGLNPYSYARCSPARFRDPSGLQTEDEIIDDLFNPDDPKVRATGPLRDPGATAIDIDEPIPVSEGGPWDDAANKTFRERLDNEVTKRNLIAQRPATPQTRISLAQAAQEGPEAFSRAARGMLDRNFSEVAELEAITREAKAAMRNLNRSPRDLANAINRSIRGRIRRGASPDAQLVQRALRQIGIDPKTLRQLPRPAAASPGPVPGALNSVTKTGSLGAVGTRALFGLLGTGLSVIASAASGYQIGTGIVELQEGNTAIGVTDIAEGTTNLGLTVGTAAGIKSGAIVVKGGWLFGGAALGSGVLAAGSVGLAFEEIRRTAEGEETLAEEGAMTWADLVVEGGNQGGVKGFMKQSAGWVGGFFSSIVAGGQNLF